MTTGAYFALVVHRTVGRFRSCFVASSIMEVCVVASAMAGGDAATRPGRERGGAGRYRALARVTGCRRWGRL